MTNYSNKNIFLILAISIPISIILLIGVVTFIYRDLNEQDKKSQNNSESNTIRPSNPFVVTKDLSKDNNLKRKTDVNTILNAIGQYSLENQNQFPMGITTENRVITSIEADICSDLVPEFLYSLPVDPNINNGNPVTSCEDRYYTGYNVQKDAQGRITVSAPLAEGEEEIAVTR